MKEGEGKPGLWHRHPRAGVWYTVGHRHLAFRREIWARNISREVIPRKWYLEPHDKMRTKRTSEK